MSHIIFETVTFNKQQYSHAYITARSVVVVLKTNHELYVDFDTLDKAKEGLVELNKLVSDETKTSTAKTTSKFGIEDVVEKITSGKADQIVAVLDRCTDRLNNILSDTKGKVKDVVMEQAMKVAAARVEGKMKDMMGNIDSVLETMFTKPYETEVNDESDDKPSKRKNFGFDNFFEKAMNPAGQVPDDILIGEMTTTDLKAEISKFVDEAVSTDKAVQMFGDVAKNFSPDEVEKAIQAFKDIIYQVACANPDSTLKDVLRNNFK